jgi:AcrR family transcriptional regulator
MAAKKKVPRKRKKPDNAADRQRRMLEAAVHEFARHGYKTASTNAMAREAGVAKGLLFHHFGSKAALFTAAFEHVVEETARQMFELDQPLPADLIDRVFELGMRKLRLFQKAPDIYQFVSTAMVDAPPSVRDPLIRKYRENVTVRWPELLDGVDASKLRKGLTVTQALETMMLLMDGFERGYVQVMRDRADHGAALLPAMTEQGLVHLKRLRDGLYR